MGFVKKKSLLILLIVLTAVSFFTRFYHLSWPPAVVFDEVYFPQFASDYRLGEYFFDIHPPHGKLFFAAAFNLLKVPTDIDWQALSKSQEFIDPAVSFRIRLLPAIFGSLLAPLVFLLVFIASRSKFAAFLSAVFILLDNALLVQSRFALMDIILIFFSCLALLFFFLAKRIDGDSKFGSRSFVLWLLCGVALGIAIGTKITALAVLGVILVFEAAEIFIGLIRRENQRLGKRLFVLLCFLATLFLVYYLGFAIHFELIGKNDQGFLDLNRQMLESNYGITQTHPFQSSWWMWLFGEKKIYYWKNIDEGAGINQNIWLEANKALWYFAEIFVLMAIFYVILLSKRTRQKIFQNINKYRYVIVLFLCLYLFYFLPMIPIKRPLFLYHYLPPITFAFVVMSLMLDSIGNKKIKYILSGLILIFVLWNFISLLPISYGL